MSSKLNLLCSISFGETLYISIIYLARLIKTQIVIVSEFKTKRSAQFKIRSLVMCLYLCVNHQSGQLFPITTGAGSSNSLNGENNDAVVCMS